MAKKATFGSVIMVLGCTLVSMYIYVNKYALDKIILRRHLTKHAYNMSSRFSGVPIAVAPCPEIPNSLIGRVIDKELPPELPWAEIDHSGLDAGGKYAPKDCQARYKVAIIIPQRDRLPHLRRLLSHMHPIWKRQQIDYQVYVVSQIDGSVFNKGMVMNAGVKEANQGKGIRNSVIEYFGGVWMVSSKQYNDSNGFSNLYWGWGGEDDDFYVRLRNKNHTITSLYGRKCSYRMIKHERDSEDPPDPARFELLKNAHLRMAVDGYNSLKYKIVSKSREYLYTNITIDIGQPTPKLEEFRRSCAKRGCRGPIPLD